VSRAAPFLLLSDVALLAQCEETHLRGSGPGGQKRNKTSSRVRLTHRPTGLTALAGEDRSQAVNKARALRRLRECIALSLRREIALETYTRSTALKAAPDPSGRLRLGPRHPHYYPVVAELLDLIAACRGGVKEAAFHAGLGTSALVRFIRSDPHVWAYVNRLREDVGLGRLK
jgi:hypothetical protein